ncbi:hypothetical protein ACUOA5_07200, partial [Escherichia coli]
MAKSLFRALVALSFLAPLWLNAAPRVITLSPANTELAFAAGITPVGVSSYSDYPPQAQKIEQVSTWQGMNAELQKNTFFRFISILRFQLRVLIQ